jgi:hypothetical protein
MVLMVVQGQEARSLSTTEMIKSQSASSASYSNLYCVGLYEPVHQLDRYKGYISVDRRPTCPIASPATYGAFATQVARTRAWDKLSTDSSTLLPPVRSKPTLI